MTEKTKPRTEGMVVLSIFNGMSFGAMALETLKIPVARYYSSEIDKPANKATQALFPETRQLGDATKWRDWDIDWCSIDLLLAGFPCQAWSFAGKQGGTSDPRGALVHDLMDIWAETKKHNPEVKFLFENVRMKKEFLDYINNLFGVEPICINSALVSAQNRVRYYWTNIEGVQQPEDVGVVLSDVIDSGIVDRDKSLCVTQRYVGFSGSQDYLRRRYFGKSMGQAVFEDSTPSQHRAAWLRDPRDPKCVGRIRKLSVAECARLQTVPKDKADVLAACGVSEGQQYMMLGNGWTHDVIVHILKGLL
ncbi:MAG: DNA cytosine methyltransferase [Ghiorsea sp.]